MNDQLLEPPRLPQSKESTCTRYDAAGATGALKYARLPGGTLPSTQVDEVATTLPEPSSASIDSCIRSAGVPGFRLYTYPLTTGRVELCATWYSSRKYRSSVSC